MREDVDEITTRVRVRVLREIEEISPEAFAVEMGFDPAEYNAW